MGGATNGEAGTIKGSSQSTVPGDSRAAGGLRAENGGGSRDDPLVHRPRSGCPIPRARHPIKILRLPGWSRRKVDMEVLTWRNPERD